MSRQIKESDGESMAKDKARALFVVELDPELAEVWKRVSCEMVVPASELMRQILESQATDFLERHSGFMDKPE